MTVTHLRKKITCARITAKAGFVIFITQKFGGNCNKLLLIRFSG
jgi:hypothetical protein